MCRKAIGVVVVLLLVARAASADVIFSTRDPVDGPNGAGVFPGSGINTYLEDGVFGGSGPYQVNSITLGYDNNTNGVTRSAEALVTFWDTVDYNASTANSGQIGTPYRLAFSATPSQNGVGAFQGFHEVTLALTGSPLIIPDGDFGVTVRFVSPGTNTVLADLNPLFNNVDAAIGSAGDTPTNLAVTVGQSKQYGAQDFDDNGTIHGGFTASGELVDWSRESDGAPSTLPYANLYFALDGSAVPEPASLGLIGLAGLMVLGRRK